MSVIKVTTDNFENEVMQSEKPVLIDFFATWCGPCKMLGPTIEELGNEISDRVKICKIDIDESEDLARRYEIRSVPTLVIINKGEVETTLVGVRSKDEIKDTLGV